LFVIPVMRSVSCGTARCVRSALRSIRRLSGIATFFAQYAMRATVAGAEKLIADLEAQKAALHPERSP
jgi:hypothetical protein